MLGIFDYVTASSSNLRLDIALLKLKMLVFCHSKFGVSSMILWCSSSICCSWLQQVAPPHHDLALQLIMGEKWSRILIYFASFLGICSFKLDCLLVYRRRFHLCSSCECFTSYCQWICCHHFDCCQFGRGHTRCCRYLASERWVKSFACQRVAHRSHSLCCLGSLECHFFLSRVRSMTG